MDKVDWGKAPDWAIMVGDVSGGDYVWANLHQYAYCSRADGGFPIAFSRDGNGACALGGFALREERPDEWKRGEERMEQIIRNSNDGEHYAELGGVIDTSSGVSVDNNDPVEIIKPTQMLKDKALDDELRSRVVSGLTERYAELEDFDKQPRYKGKDGLDWIDEFARDNSIEDFRAAMRFTIGKYEKRLGKKDDRSKELYKISDYYKRWSEVEKKLELEGLTKTKKFIVGEK